MLKIIIKCVFEIIIKLFTSIQRFFITKIVFHLLVNPFNFSLKSNFLFLIINF
jgi:hypothetical protein